MEPQSPLTGIGCSHRPWVQAVNADGSTRIIEPGIPQQTLEALFTPDGGEPVEGD